MAARIATAAATAALVLGCALAAGAASLSLAGGALTTLPASYATEPGSPAGFGADTAIRLFDRANAGSGGLWLSGSSAVRFTFLGKAAAYDNVAVGTFALFSNNAAAEGDRATGQHAGPGYLGFGFRSDGPGGRQARNHGPIAAGPKLGFLLEGPRSAVAFFDDGGAGPDLDLNDMVVRINVVPLPAAGLMLLGAFGGLGLLARGRRAC